jgi:hypothetical protein
MARNKRERFPDLPGVPELSPVDFDETEPVAPGWVTYSGTYTNHDARSWAPQEFRLTTSSPLTTGERLDEDRARREPAPATPDELAAYTRQELEEYTRQARFWFEAVATDSPFGQEQDDDTTQPADLRERSRAEHERHCREIEQSRPSECDPELCSLIVLETEMISESPTGAVVYASVDPTIRRNARHDWLGDKWVRLEVTRQQVYFGGVVGAKSYYVTGGFTAPIKANGACYVRGEKAISTYRLDAGWKRK